MTPPHTDLQQLFALFNARRYAEMAQQAQRLLQRYPASGELWKALSVALQVQGKDALAALQKAVALLPGDADLPGNLASLLAAQGRHAEAATAYRQALALRPDNAGLHNNLGNALVALDRRDEALVCYQRALKLQPDFAVAQRNVALTLKQLDRWEDALAAFQQLAAMQADDPQTQVSIGLLELDLGRPDAAIASFRNALVLQPDMLAALLSLGGALSQLGDFEASAATFRRALQLAPDDAAAHADLGLALQGQGDLETALLEMKRALALRPEDATMLGNLGKLLKDMGRANEALAYYRRAVELQPDDLLARGALLFAQNYAANSSDGQLDDALAYGRLAARQARPFDSWTGDEPNPARPLRVGLVSPDLRAHPVGFFAESVLAALASERVELFVYANTPMADAVSARIRAHCRGWLVCHQIDDATLARRIRADGIDILLDLSGHTAHNRLPMFALKPAPVQASWLGYCATTGLAAMDFFLADPWIAPPGSEAQFTENLARLPETFLCFTPPAQDLPVGPLPALTQGQITFGCFNNPAKLNDAVLALWARILQAMPDSRLLLKAKPLGDEAGRRAMQSRFAALGIAVDRLLLEGAASHADYLAAFHRVDIALDPFPYPGGTTSVEGLWMGVPVLSLAGERALARQGVSILQNIGLPEWIAADADDYLARAVRHANDLPALAELRGQLRPRLLASPLCDAPRFAGHFEALLRSVIAGRHDLKP